MILTSLVPSKDAEALNDAAEDLGPWFWEGKKGLNTWLLQSLCINYINLPLLTSCFRYFNTI
uniref:Uncharacterized protein n=1 Tax=Urocitellus parryii TaxID=9999 RepID=A0A8D2HRH8_UROPR